jgi:hypothetical protein
MSLHYNLRITHLVIITSANSHNPDKGVLPLAMLALVTVLVPTVLRTLANLQGSYSHRAVETSLQTYYSTTPVITMISIL